MTDVLLAHVKRSARTTTRHLFARAFTDELVTMAILREQISFARALGHVGAELTDEVIGERASGANEPSRCPGHNLFSGTD